MTTNSTKVMTLEQVRDTLRGFYNMSDMELPLRGEYLLLADAIDTHLAPREVSDEDVEFVWDQLPTHISITRRDVRLVLQADRQRGGGVKVLPSELQGAIDYLTVVTCSSHLPGWKKNREMWGIVWNALLAQRGQVREVFVCSNKACGAVFANDPMGHCPACIEPSGLGFSTTRRDVR